MLLTAEAPVKNLVATIQLFLDWKKWQRYRTPQKTGKTWEEERTLIL